MVRGVLDLPSAKLLEYCSDASSTHATDGRSLKPSVQSTVPAQRHPQNTCSFVRSPTVPVQGLDGPTIVFRDACETCSRLASALDSSGAWSSRITTGRARPCEEDESVMAGWRTQRTHGRVNLVPAP